MFDIGFEEIFLIVVVAVLVIGPKELPGALRSLGKIVRLMRGYVNDLRRSFDDAVREAGLEDVKRDLTGAVNTIQNPVKTVRSSLEPITSAVKDLDKVARAEVEKTDKKVETSAVKPAEGTIESKPPAEKVASLDTLKPEKQEKSSKQSSDKQP